MSARRLAIALAALLLAGCAVLELGEPLGTVSNPVRADGWPGQRTYLGRLRCPSGGAPHVHYLRRGPRGPHGNGLDRFGLRCVRDNRSYEILMDRYHEGYVENRPVADLGLAEASEIPAVLKDMIPEEAPHPE